MGAAQTHSIEKSQTATPMKLPRFFEHKGEQYDRIHLQPTQLTLMLSAHKDNPELELLLEVNFSTHCYSEGTPKVVRTSLDLLENNNWQRWFCFDRGIRMDKEDLTYIKKRSLNA